MKLTEQEEKQLFDATPLEKSSLMFVENRRIYGYHLDTPKYGQIKTYSQYLFFKTYYYIKSLFG